MLRKPEDIKREIDNFYRNKGVQCSVDVSEKLIIKVEIARVDGEVYEFKFPNRFFGRGENRDSALFLAPRSSPRYCNVGEFTKDVIARNK